MAGEILRANEPLKMSIERDTVDVPRDGRYHLVHAGDVIFSSRVLAAVEVEYEDLKETLTATARELRAKERAHYDMQGVRSDSYVRRSANARKKGGRGGRGGV